MKYTTPDGYTIKLSRGGYGARDQYIARTNDSDFVELIEKELDWADKGKAEEDLKLFAIRHNLTDIS
jgi:hypothetical protein